MQYIEVSLKLNNYIASVLFALFRKKIAKGDAHHLNSMGKVGKPRKGKQELMTRKTKF